MKTIQIINFFDNKIKNLRIKSKKATTERLTVQYKSMALAYSRVNNILKESFTNSEIMTTKKINKLPITDHMKRKIIGLIKNFKQPNENLENNLTKFMGIGSLKAKELIKKGLVDIKQLRQKKYKMLLTDQTRAFLSLKPIKKISHNDIEKLESLLTKSSIAEMIIVGSYRRNTKFSKDIDIMVVSNDENVLEKIIKMYIKKIGSKRVIPYIIGKDKVSIIIKLNITYKIDIFRTPKNSKYAMLLYSTGPRSHNIRMRSIAKKKGFLLNQNGLFKRNTGKLLSGRAKSEKYFFDKLGMIYKFPEERH